MSMDDDGVSMSPSGPTPDEFSERLAAPTPTPGGGAAAARVGLYATSLLRMVTSITLSKRAADEGTDAADELRRVEERAVALADELRRLESSDVEAFKAYLEALRLPKATAEERSRRDEARAQAAAHATEVPLAMLGAALEVLELARRLVDLASTLRLRAESDIGGAVELAHASFRAAELNVRVNLPALGDEDRRVLEEWFRKLLARLDELYPRLRRAILGWFGS